MRIEIYSIPLYFVCVALLLTILGAPVFKAIDRPPSPTEKRFGNLDGLRGYLALSVFFHHAAIYYLWLRDGVWALPPSSFFTLLGEVSVCLLFITTGFLFWNKAIDAKGRLNFLNLYTGRLFRLAPLYLAALTVVNLMVFWEASFTLAVPLRTVIREVLHNYSLGYLGIIDVNGDQRTWIKMAGVTWTLKYEWQFYASLLLTGVLCRRMWLSYSFVGLGLAVSAAIVWLHQKAPGPAPSPDVCILLFFCGMAISCLCKRGMTIPLPGTALSVTATASLFLLFCADTSVNRPEALALVAVVFYAVVSGADLFGLLTLKASLRLGDISYGIYLFQGPAFYLMSRAYFGLSPFADAGANHWAFTAITMIGLALLAAILHRAIETPGIALGRKVSGRIAGWLRRRRLVEATARQ